ncbi:MAG: hypothetical protein AAGA75_13225 [Cyanobacteria bacterium P01_E01_bin.6]
MRPETGFMHHGSSPLEHFSGVSGHGQDVQSGDIDILPVIFHRDRSSGVSNRPNDLTEMK